MFAYAIAVMRLHNKEKKKSDQTQDLFEVCKPIYTSHLSKCRYIFGTRLRINSTVTYYSEFHTL